ncbi:ER-golgi trafficking TRAPP I complex 85 kDa subunit-domain-containing protein [Mycotypha africana]|uniref:ER-golgi trafficking TRAPP I complex 85 kDa subunit-domain-containing protein n=1 Tax=Mycotypha africana TaxID=64632 RepID=UPI002300EE7A|nr:ER-golgi trafficking TRAPP I complex 85 kDa subunit-domain-containing protein [Mycotypha africana]KAI8984692.1 ER-golgi trafficking TRAPP I complex 85 kDa subunit-domain-containing protein [Mycotypha africana]
MEKPLPLKPPPASTMYSLDFIAQTLSPVIAVTASDDAEALCRLNHIPSVTDLLKPFGAPVEGRGTFFYTLLPLPEDNLLTLLLFLYTLMKVTPRDWQGVPIPIDQFMLRLKPIHRLDEPNHQSVMKMMEDKMKRYPNVQPQENSMIRTKQDVTDDYLNTPLDQFMPWYIDFKKTLLSLRGITEYETFDHPVATMVVISSANPDPLQTIMQLYNPNIPSFTVDRPYIHPNVLRYYVVLHDPTTTSDEQANDLFEKLKKTVGLHCYLLRINSKPRRQGEEEEEEEYLAEEAIRAIWHDTITDTYRLESDLQSFTEDNNSTDTSSLSSLSLSNMNTSSVMPTVQHPPPPPPPDRISSPISITSPTSMSPSSSPSHSRANSILSSNSQQTLPTSTTIIQGTSIQSVPVDMEVDTQRNENNPTESVPQEDASQDRQPSSIQYGCLMTFDDIQNLKSMMRAFVTQSLLPFMERNIQHWNEQIAAPRRGLTGRLFGASRRLFGGNSRSFSSHPPPSVQFLPVNHQNNSNVPHGVHQLMVYPHNTPEAQLRKLADYAFMLRDYKFAYTIYDTVRRDFATEKAYAYHAGTLEMMAFCQLFLTATRQDGLSSSLNSHPGTNTGTHPYSSNSDNNNNSSSSNNNLSKSTVDIASIDRHMELAIQQYLTRCRLPYYATRTTIMYYELLKACGFWKEIPTALVRMTGEDWDVRSGLFLELAAHAFLKRKRKSSRLLPSANATQSRHRGLRNYQNSSGQPNEGRGGAMVRKYAFHLVMAGHRYGKALQRVHAYRCYQLASFVFPAAAAAGAARSAAANNADALSKDSREDDEYKYQHSLKNKGWSVAQSHIQFALGRQAFHLGKLEEAVHHFAHVLSDNNNSRMYQHQKTANNTEQQQQQQQQQSQSVQQQMAHIREFLYIYKQYAASQGVVEDPSKVCLLSADVLQLPVIDVQKGIKVTLSNKQQQQQEVAAAAAADTAGTPMDHHATNLSDDQDLWAQMELALLENSIANGFISSSKKRMAVQQQDDQRIVCAVGEPTIVHIQLYNPLLVALQLSDLILGCQYKKPDATNNENGDREEKIDHTIMPEGKPKENDADMLEYENYDLQTIQSLTLEPLEKATISLTIIPRHEGSVQIQGLHYTLNELVHTFKYFHKRGKRLNRTKEERMSVVYSQDRSMDILVTSPMPLLELTCHQVPGAILSGEVIQTVLEVYNKGNKGLTALRVKTSHPSFICIGNLEDMDKDIYADRTATGSTSTSLTVENQLFDPSVITIPLPANKAGNGHGVVMPGETTLIPLWIRGDRIGKHSIKLLFSYQPDDHEDNNKKNMIAHRTLHYTLPLQVIPSLKINAFTRPSNTFTTTVPTLSAADDDQKEKKDERGYILGVEIENLQTLTNFGLVQLTVNSPVWSISPLSVDLTSKEDVEAKTTIPARQTTYAYYKITKKTSQTKEDEISEKVGDSSPEAWTANGLRLFHSGELLDRKSVIEKPAPIGFHVDNLSFRDDGQIAFDSPTLKSFSLNARMQWRQNNLESQYPYVPQDLYPQLFNLYNTGDIDFTMYWEASPSVTAPTANPTSTDPNSTGGDDASAATHKRRGHHYIIGINLTDPEPAESNLSTLATAVNTTNNDINNNIADTILNRSLFDMSARERSLLLQTLMQEATKA